METETVWLGLDLGQKRTHVCVIDQAGETLHEQSCETTLPALESAMSGFPIHRMGLIAVEAGSDIHIVRKLRDAGFPVALFEARKASRFLAVRRNKTDASDAKGLADIGRLGRNTISQVYLKSPACQHVRSQLIMRKKLVLLRVAAEGAIRSRFALHGIRFRSTAAPGAVREQVQTRLSQIKADEDVNVAADVMPLVEVCESLRTYLTKLDSTLKERAKSHEICRLLMEVPGVGPICALSFYSAIEDPTRFRKASDVAAYLGLVPRRYQSGELSRTLGITKTGNKLTRTHLVTAATVFGNFAPDSALKEWYMKLRERAGSGRARVALARKLSIILLTMWKNGAHFEPSPSSAA
jgi:transposase